MSQTCDSERAPYRKRHPPPVGVEANIWLLLLQKGLTCDIASQPDCGDTPCEGTDAPDYLAVYHVGLLDRSEAHPLSYVARL
jgi:hypothetical protein